MPIARPLLRERMLAAFSICSLSAGLLLVVILALGDITAGLQAVFGAASITLLGTGIALREVLARIRAGLLGEDLRAKLRQLEENNRLLSLTETQARVGHWRISLSNDEIYWSPGTFAIHGLELGEPPALGDAIKYFHPDDREIVANAVETSRVTGDAYEFRARLIREDGELRHTQSIALVETDEDGSPIALFGVFCDRTEEEEMQAELRAARNRADAMAQAKSAFLAKMSHEIRTPMNGVIGFAELLSRSDLAPEQARFVDLITESGKSLQTLLNDILDMSKIEAGAFPIKQAATDLSHLVERTMQLFEPLAGEKSISLSCYIDPALPSHIIVDGLRLRQVLSNLISNAVRFTDVGEVSLSVKARNDAITFTVRDTGIGIAKDVQQTIFDPFSQDLGAKGTCRGGTGLGLTISRQLSELMGGNLTLVSAPEQGSAFTVSLPLKPADPLIDPSRTSAQVQPANPAYLNRNLRILLAEDFDINQELICEMGKQLGLDFELANDGQQAVDAVLTAHQTGEPFSLVLMDLQMPRLDGLQATRAIRAAGIDGQALPIIALTANAFADDIAVCLDAGMQEHVAKPVELGRLSEALGRWLRPYGHRNWAA